MRTRIKVLLLFSLVFSIIVGTTVLKTNQAFFFKDDSNIGDGDDGALTAKTSLIIYDENGNVQQVAWMAGFDIEQGAIDPGARGVDDPIKDAAYQCSETNGFHWDYDIGECVTNREAPAPDDSVVGTDDPTIPQVDIIPISGDFDKIQFVLEWAEIEGVKIVKESIYIKIKARILLKDDTWSTILDSLEIKYWKGEFKDLSVSGDYFKIRCDASTMIDDDINVHKDEILAKVSYSEIKQPLTLRFYYYAKGDPTDGGVTIESNTINKLIVVEGDLGSNLGLIGSVLFAPIAMVHTRRRS